MGWRGVVLGTLRCVLCGTSRPLECCGTKATWQLKGLKGALLRRGVQQKDACAEVPSAEAVARDSDHGPSLFEVRGL